MTTHELKRKVGSEPKKVEEFFYPPANIQKKDIPIPDVQRYYDRMMERGSKANLFFLWLEYKQENPDGYQTTQFYEWIYVNTLDKNLGFL